MNTINQAPEQRYPFRMAVMIAAVALALVVAAYVWGGRLLADTRQSPSESPAAASLQLSRDASAARYAAMDAFYGATAGANLQRSSDANAARYTAMGAFYAAKAASDLQRANSASAARFAAMDAFYSAKAPAQ
jgi:hypothetical protein